MDEIIVKAKKLSAESLKKLQRLKVEDASDPIDAQARENDGMWHGE